MRIEDDWRQSSILNPESSIPEGNPQSPKGKAWSGPVSRVLFLLRGENHSSAARITAAVEQPTRTLRRTRASPLRPYLVLLRRGFAVPSTLTCDAVRSYRTVSPLPRHSCEHRSAVCFLLHVPSRHRAWPLASLLPVGVRTFLGSTLRLRSGLRRDPPVRSTQKRITGCRSKYSCS